MCSFTTFFTVIKCKLLTSSGNLVYIMLSKWSEGNATDCTYLGKHALILDHIFIGCEENVEFCGPHLTLYLPSHGRWALVCHNHHRRCPLIKLQNPVGQCAAKKHLVINEECQNSHLLYIVFILRQTSCLVETYNI
jgi:hypothetical protein